MSERVKPETAPEPDEIVHLPWNEATCGKCGMDRPPPLTPYSWQWGHACKPREPHLKDGSR